MARILIVGGGCRGRRLALALVSDGNVVRVSTRTEATRGSIEATGAECWIGTPDRLATLRGALDGVTVLCWLLGSAAGSLEQLRALHSSRLEFFITQAVDTTVRGIVYEAAGDPAAAGTLASDGAAPDAHAAARLVSDGAGIVRTLAERNAIPARFITADLSDAEAWLKEARASIGSLL